MSEALVRIEPPGTLDVQARKRAIDELLNKVALVMEAMDRVMEDGVHYGKIQGAGDKKILFKAGAEKLGLTFHLKPSFNVVETDLGNYHRNFRVTCTLSDGAEGVGSCSTLEKKYRYRKKYENNKVVGQVENEDPADCWNTCLKMAKKRAHVDAIITATASSDILTQDVEEAIDAANATVEEAPKSKAPATQPNPFKGTKAAEPADAKPPVAEQWKTYFLDQVNKRTWGIWAWQWAIGKDFLMLGDNLKDIAAANCPQSKGEHAKAMTEIKAILDSFPKGISQELDEAYTKAHLDDLGPQEAKEAEPAWKSVEFHFGPNKGMTLGEMSHELPKKLWGWWSNFKPEPFKGKLNQVDVDLRAALDECGEYMGYSKKEDREQTQDAPAKMMGPHEDDVPF